eukprot:334250-Pelagomonas_calceolata.AAC.1
MRAHVHGICCLVGAGATPLSMPPYLLRPCCLPHFMPPDFTGAGAPPLGMPPYFLPPCCLPNFVPPSFTGADAPFSACRFISYLTLCRLTFQVQELPLPACRHTSHPQQCLLVGLVGIMTSSASWLTWQSPFALMT